MTLENYWRTQVAVHKHIYFSRKYYIVFLGVNLPNFLEYTRTPLFQLSKTQNIYKMLGGMTKPTYKLKSL